jgi:hypothetical protein
MGENANEQYASTLIWKYITHPSGQRLISLYRRVFSIKEIEDSLMLQWAMGALLLVLLTAFYFFGWSGSGIISTAAYNSNTHLCWPYFQSCGEWYFFDTLAEGYAQTTFYMFLFGLILAVAYCMWRREWVLAHLGLVLLFTWKLLVMFVLTAGMHGNYDYYDVLLGFPLLFLPHKEFFLRLVFVLLYFLASTIKMHEGWVLGTYFSTIHSGLPFLGHWLIPLATNIVIFEQVVGCWFLLSRNVSLQRATLAFFVFFHLYSGILVGYRYPLTALAFLLVLFGPNYRSIRIPFDRRATLGWVFVALLFCMQYLAFFIPGDQQWTLEGNFYGLSMFNGNHQCRSIATAHYKDGSTRKFYKESVKSWDRCDPYPHWFHLKEICKREGANMDHIDWMFDHSLNGGPFYRGKCLRSRISPPFTQCVDKNNGRWSSNYRLTAFQ